MLLLPSARAHDFAPRLRSLAPRVGASLAHLAISGLVAALTAGLVFAFWYPMPYRESAGGRELFMLVLGVDVVLGPLLTLIVFDVRKSRRELARDLAVIGAVQLAGLAYGLYTVEGARPVAVALEGDRLRVVRSIDLTLTLRRHLLRCVVALGSDQPTLQHGHPLPTKSSMRSSKGWAASISARAQSSGFLPTLRKPHGDPVRARWPAFVNCTHRGGQTSTLPWQLRVGQRQR
jgi:hypothetical protein